MESNGLGMSVRASAHRVIRGGSWNNDAQDVPRGVPQPQRALEPEQRPGLPLCRAHDGAGRLPPEQTGVLSVVSGDGEWLSTAGVLVARRRCAGERSPVVFPESRNGDDASCPTSVDSSPQRGIPPAWASEWGEDRLHGPWCAFEVGDVVQRLSLDPSRSFLDGVAGG